MKSIIFLSSLCLPINIYTSQKYTCDIVTSGNYIHSDFYQDSLLLSVPCDVFLHMSLCLSSIAALSSTSSYLYHMRDTLLKKYSVQPDDTNLLIDVIKTKIYKNEMKHFLEGHKGYKFIEALKLLVGVCFPDEYKKEYFEGKYIDFEEDLEADFLQTYQLEKIVLEKGTFEKKILTSDKNKRFFIALDYTTPNEEIDFLLDYIATDSSNNNRFIYNACIAGIMYSLNRTKNVKALYCLYDKRIMQMNDIERYKLSLKDILSDFLNNKMLNNSEFSSKIKCIYKTLPVKSQLSHFQEYVAAKITKFFGVTRYGYVYF